MVLVAFHRAKLSPGTTTRERSSRSPRKLSRESTPFEHGGKTETDWNGRERVNRDTWIDEDRSIESRGRVASPREWVSRLVSNLDCSRSFFFLPNPLLFSIIKRLRVSRGTCPVIQEGSLLYRFHPLVNGILREGYGFVSRSLFTSTPFTRKPRTNKLEIGIPMDARLRRLVCSMLLDKTLPNMLAQAYRFLIFWIDLCHDETWIDDRR